MNRNEQNEGRHRVGIALVGITAVCVLAYCVGSGWALPGLFGIGYIVGKLHGSDCDGDDGFMGI